MQQKYKNVVHLTLFFSFLILKFKKISVNRYFISVLLH